MKSWRIISNVLLFVGITCIILALVADILGVGGQTGFGPKQAAMVIVGTISIAFGIIVTTNIFYLTLARVRYPTPEDQAPVSLIMVKDKFIVILTIGIWFGFVTGYLEILIIVISKYYIEKFYRLSRDFIWMTAVADVMIFVVISLLLILLAVAWSKLASVGFISFIFTFFLTVSLCFVHPIIAVYAVGLLAVGISFQIAKFINRRQSAFFRIVTRSLPWMVIITGVSILATFIFLH